MRKKGITLVEVMVSMGLFAVLASIIVGAFILILNMKTLVSGMKESQQKTRMALELVSRLARQANRVVVSNYSNTSLAQGNIVDFYFPSATPATPPSTRFTIGSMVSGGKITLYSKDCIGWGSGTCNVWTAPNDLLGGLVSLEQTNFMLSAIPPANPPTLSITLNGIINGVSTNPYYSNNFNIDNKVILESLPWAQY
jgi:prepilin-type N-terminal cleavage/methylation domain-containing protein